jgi:hypothetical protein
MRLMQMHLATEHVQKRTLASETLTFRVLLLQSGACSTSGKKRIQQKFSLETMRMGELGRKAIFFFLIPFYLQAVHVHSANGGTLRKA